MVAELDGLVYARIEAARASRLWDMITRSSGGTGNDGEPDSIDVEFDSRSIDEFHVDSGETKHHTDIIQWLSAIRGPVNQSPVHQPDTSSITDERTHVLEDGPALVSYATYELFSHAQLAEKYGAEMAPFIRWMTSAWERWLAPREDIPLGTSLLHYADYPGLHSWVRERGRGLAGPQRAPRRDGEATAQKQ